MANPPYLASHDQQNYPANKLRGNPAVIGHTNPDILLHMPQHSFLKFLAWSAVVPILGLIYASVVLYSRREENRAFEREALEKKHAQDEEDAKRMVDALGGSRFQILNFYGSPGVIRRGETAQLCYGVANAKSVEIEPRTDGAWPSYSRCVDVAPKKTTTYTLTTKDAAGNTKTATVTIEVH